LTDDAQLLYQHTAAYAPQAEGGIAFDDPDLGIAWPLPATLVSERDRGHPRLRDIAQGVIA
jgi:dTDP-4-dehydrorhamnose 3,5-epimerase